MEEIGTLKADVDELRRAVEIERETAFKAAGEAKQEGEAAKQLRSVRPQYLSEPFILLRSTDHLVRLTLSPSLPAPPLPFTLRR